MPFGKDFSIRRVGYEEKNLDKNSYEIQKWLNRWLLQLWVRIALLRGQHFLYSMLLACERKILTVEDLIQRLADRGGKKLVHCHGCYDFLHPGHLYHFEFAKTLGDWLLVSLNADAYFSNKGPGRPIFNERLRAIAVAALEVVDFVCIYPGRMPEKIFENIRPEIYVKGIEYDYRGLLRQGRKIPEEAMVAKYGGRVVYGPEENIYSSTELIRALQACRLE